MDELPLPNRLSQLIANRIWPSSEGPSMTAQQLRPLVTPELVRRFAEDESLICFQPPPFPTIEDLRSAGKASDFWERFGSLTQIVPAQAIVIGDFGLGSDSPIVLDYARDRVNPPVLRLRWKQDQQTEWVEGAHDFDAFAAMLELD
jgi:hypothetical protein